VQPRALHNRACVDHSATARMIKTTYPGYDPVGLSICSPNEGTFGDIKGVPSVFEVRYAQAKHRLHLSDYWYFSGIRLLSFASLTSYRWYAARTRTC
jgi:hypothetical protein